MRRLAIRACLALGILQGAFGQTAPARPAANWKSIQFPKLRDIQTPKVEETTLPNGMKVYLLENHELPTVRGTALVRTGNLFDPKDKVGLAGLTGTTIRSGGTMERSGDQIDEQLENIAASVESSIGETSGSVSFFTLKERSAEVLQVFHDVLTKPGFRQDRIDLAKSQIRSGISRRNDEPRDISQREFADLVYGRDNPYGWQMEYEHVDNIQRPDIEAFYRRYFFPANTLLAVQGDFNAAEMKASLEKLFSDWTVKQAQVPAFPKVANNPKPGIYVAAREDVNQTNFALGQFGGVLNDKDAPALEVMADILGDGFSSRLFQKVRTKLGYAYEVNANWGVGYDHPGLFEISGSTKSESTADTLKAIDQEVRRIREAPVTAEELESARQKVENSFVFNFDTPSKTLGRLLTYRYFGYPDDFVFTYQKAVAAVTQADIQRVAQKYLDPSKFVIVATGNPKEFGKPLSSLDLPVSNLDLTIPEPKAKSTRPAAGPENAGAVAKGKALLSRAADALGGTEKLVGVKDFVQSGTIQLDQSAGGLKVTQNSQWLAPSHFRQENVLPFGKVATYSDGKTGWSSTPNGLGPLPPAQLNQIAFETFKLWFTLLPSGTDPDRTVTADAAGKVEVSDKAGHSLTLTFDDRTGLPASLSYSAPGNPNGLVEESYSDWQDAGGVKLPRKITMNQGGKHFADVTVSAASVNTGLTVEQISKKP